MARKCQPGDRGQELRGARADVLAVRQMAGVLVG